MSESANERQEWHLQVDGKPFHVSAGPSPNGKIAVRVNGRIVAPPQSAGKVDCWFHVGVAPYHLSSRDSGLQLEPVTVVDTTHAEVPPQPFPADAIDPRHLRAAVFLAVGLILFLIAGCNALVVPRPSLNAEDVRAMGKDLELANVFQLNAAIRFAFLIETGVGLAMMCGAVMLFGRIRSSATILEIAAWAMVVGAALSLAIIDVLAHRQIFLVGFPERGRSFLRGVHTLAVLFLIILGLGSGILSSFLDRKAIQQLPA